MAERYKIYEQLGAGGVGAVFRAYDNELKRWVAIKRLMIDTEAVGDKKLAADLRREADALASLRNPNIVTIFDVASDAEGLFMVMELLEGEDLADIVARGPLHYDDFKELASQTLEGLLAAHQHHILHRDIKPENIKVERLPGGRMQSKIIDFGLARAGLRARKQTEDQEGTVMGSIFYMAPEQLTRAPVDERTDLYSLATVFYEALSGRKAFDGESMSIVIDKHINHDIIPLHVVAPHVPPWLGAWVQRLMALRPEDRPVNAQQAIEELRAWEKMAAAPAMMPWMPVGYGYAPPQGMPGSYTQPMYPPGTGTVQIMQGTPTTSSVPVQPVYYQTGQAPPVMYVPQQQPLEYAQPVPEVVQEAVPVLELAARTTSLVHSAPHRSSPAAPARHATQNDVRQQPGGLAALLASPQIKKYALIGGGALVVIIGGCLMLSIGDKKEAGSTDATTGTTGSKSAGPEKVSFQLPNERQFPPQDADLTLHFVAGTGQVRKIKDSAGKPLVANAGDMVFEWHDLAARGKDNLLRAFQSDMAHSPLRQVWQHVSIKSTRTTVDWRPRADKPCALLLADPAGEAQHFPFGSAGTKLSKGLTLATVFQADVDKLPTRVLTLTGGDGSSVSLRIGTDKQVMAEFRNSSSGTSNIVSKDMDGTRPLSTILTWQADTGATSLRVRDTAGKTFSATGSALAAPGKPLTKLQIGRVQESGGQPALRDDQFNGWLAELLVYASVLRTDQVQLLEGPNLKDFYFNYTANVSPLAQRLKTKLPQIEPRTTWKLSASSNEGELKNTVDGNAGTRWSTRARQAPGQWFRIELPGEQDVTGIALDSQGSTNDYPRKYVVEFSQDGTAWTMAAEGEGKSPLLELVFPTPQRARHLRIRQEGQASANDWSIYEVAIFKK